jgi:hypothetical protein
MVEECLRIQPEKEIGAQKRVEKRLTAFSEPSSPTVLYSAFDFLVS